MQAIRALIFLNLFVVSILADKSAEYKTPKQKTVEKLVEIIIDPRDTRDVIGFCLSIVSNNEIEGAKEYGVFRL